MWSHVQYAYMCICEDGHVCGHVGVGELSVHVLVRMCGCLCGSEGAAHLLHYRLNLDRRSGVLRLLSSAENLGYHAPLPIPQRVLGTWWFEKDVSHCLGECEYLISF